MLWADSNSLPELEASSPAFAATLGFFRPEECSRASARRAVPERGVDGGSTPAAWGAGDAAADMEENLAPVDQRDRPEEVALVADGLL